MVRRGIASIVPTPIKNAIERWTFGEYDGPKIGPIKFPFKLKVE